MVYHCAVTIQQLKKMKNDDRIKILSCDHSDSEGFDKDISWRMSSEAEILV